MGALYTPNIPYDLNTFLDNLPAYSLSEEGVKILDTCREIILSRKYYFMGIPFPTNEVNPMVGLLTQSANVVVPPLSYLLAISGDAFYTVGQGGISNTRSLEGFKFRIYDKGAKLDIVVSTQYAEGISNLGVMANLSAPNIQTNVPIGPMFLDTPFVVLDPGSLQMELTNLSQSTVYCQMFLHFAVPVNRQSANENLVRSGGNLRSLAGRAGAGGGIR